MIGHFFKRHAYIDLESPINVMSRRKYNRIMTYELGSRQKPSNPNKISNFVGRVRSIKFFKGSFAYECDFMILEDTTCIIDRHLGEMAFGRPFIDEIGLVYNREEETVFSIWMTFEGNTHDLGSFREEMNEITDLHQILEEVLLTECGDDVGGLKQHRRDPSSDGVRDLVMASGRSRLNEDLESST
ncbi:hypothetical protein Tco_1466244 [Tanacetum coccineum]